MKKTLSLILSIVALAGVVALFVMHFACNKTSCTAHRSASADTLSVMPVGEGIVYVNIDSLVRGYDMYFDLQKEFEAKANKKGADFSAKMKKFEADARDFQDKVEKGLVTRSQAQQLQDGLAKRQQDLQQLQQQLQLELQEEEAVLMRQIQNNIQTYIVEYNKEKGYSLILSATGSAVVLYGAPALNITNEVLLGLNETYLKTRKAK